MASSAPRTYRLSARGPLVLAAAFALVACNGGPGVVDEAPSLAAIPDQSTTLGEPVEVAVTVTDEEPGTVDLTATSSDEQVVPAAGLALSGAGEDRTLTVTPGSVTPGTAVVTVTATDGGGKSSSVQFEVVVDRPFAGEPALLTPQNADLIGTSVAMDGGVAVAGGIEYAYVFELDGDTWVEREKLDSAVNGIVTVQDFGDAVAVEGDRVLVGAAETDGDATDQGTVFGEALDVSGDLLVVGDYGNDQRGVDAGAAYVFEAEAGFWNEVAKLAPAELEAGDQFGLAVAADDGWVLVGSWNDDDAGQEAGAVYVFHDAGSGWQLVDKLLASDAAPFASFGGSLALDYPYAVVGAHYEDSAADNAGAVYVLRHDGTTWHEVAKLTSPHAAAGGGFGFDVDVSGEHLIVSQLQSPTFTAVYRR